jgi:hypothetical protein
MTPNVAFRAENVAPLIPCRRQTSAVFAPFGMALEPVAGSCLTLLAQDREDLLLGELRSLHVRSSRWAGLMHQMQELSGLTAGSQGRDRPVLRGFAAVCLP